MSFTLTLALAILLPFAFPPIIVFMFFLSSSLLHPSCEKKGDTAEHKTRNMTMNF